MTGLWGRERETEVLDRLAGTDTGTNTGTDMGVVIVGEPGIGKSSLWTRGVAAARAAGVRALAITCVEGERDMPYAGLEDLLGDLPDELPEGELPAPQRAALDGAFLRAQGATPAGPRTVAAGVLTVLRRTLERGPVLLAVDDLQWMDEETATCLGYAVRRLVGGRLTLLLATRDPSPLWCPDREPVDNAPLATGLITLRLGPLPGDAIRGLLRDRLGLTLTPEEGRAIAEQTGGSPFWALEFGRGWRGLIDGASPPSLATLVADRIADLDPAVVDVACLVAACGRARTAGVLRAAELPDGAATEPILDAAVAAGLVTVVGDRLTPSHPLVGAALVAALLPLRRRRLHRRAAALAESTEARALHLLRADAERASGGRNRAEHRELVAALDAARLAAQHRGAAGTAARFGARALAILDEHERTTGDGAARLVTIAELHYRAGERDATLAVLERVELGDLDTELLERAAPLLAETLNEKQGGPAARAVADTLDALPRDDLSRHDLLRRHALVATLRADLHCGATGDRRIIAGIAVAQAETAPARPPLRRRALGALALALLDRGEQADMVLDQLDALQDPADPEAAAQPGSGVDVALIRGLSRWYTLDLAGARAVFAATFERRVETGDAPAIVRAAGMLAYMDLLAGRTASAETILARMEANVDRRAVEGLYVVYARGMLHLLRGEHDALEALLDRQAASGNQSVRSLGFANRLRGTLAWQRGDPEQAVRYLDRFAEIAGQYGYPHFYRCLHTDVDLATALIAVGEHARAARVIEGLDRYATEVGHPVLRGQQRRLAARLAAHRDEDLDRAEALAREAVALHEPGPLPAEFGQSLDTLADVYRRRGEFGPATEHRRRAHRLFADIGYRWWADRTAAPDRLHLARTLSGSERAVAALVATGTTNREAAATLHVAARTVENHLRSVYRKLGIRSRVELADYPGVVAGERGQSV